MKWKKCLLEHLPLIIILLAALAVRIYFLSDYHPVWWDSAVYEGMGKFIFSLGHSGLWEGIRPVVWPAFLGMFWFLGLDPLFFGLVLQILMSIAIVYMVYKICKDIFDENAALFACAILSFGPIFLFMAFRNYVEIPSTFFVLLSVAFLLRRNSFWAGIFLALSALTKFTAILFVIPFGVYLLLKKKTKEIAFLSIGYVLVFVPFLLLNIHLYGSAFYPFLEANKVISHVVACNYLEYQPFSFYFVQFFADNFFYLLIPVGILLSLKKWNNERFFILLCLLVPLIYFLQLNCRQYRYMITFLPFAACFAGLALSRLIKIIRPLFPVALLIVVIVSLVTGISYYKLKESPGSVQFSYLDAVGHSSGEVWTTNPIITIFTDSRIKLLYEGTFNSSVAQAIDFDVFRNLTKIDYLFYDSCSGGLTCLPNDFNCAAQRQKLLSHLLNEFKIEEFVPGQLCSYYLFKKA